jgi:ribonuclease BN (tRNA processing enzyme)
MQLTILGSGTIAPSVDRNPSGMVLRNQDLIILIDLGPGTLRRLCEAKIDWKLIDIVLITHFHPDHVSDLVPFLFASNYAYENPRLEPFHTVGPRGLEHFFEIMVSAYGHWIIPSGNRRIGHELDEKALDSLQISSLLIRSAPSNHSNPSLSYRLEAENKSLAVSGDTDHSDFLIEIASGADAFVCETSFPDGMKREGHLTPSEAAKIAQKAGVKKLILTHFYPAAHETDVVNQASRFFSGEIIKAQDLMVIKL